MTSKNSFWVSLKENNKRRVWLWILSAFAYLVMLPTITALIISSCKTNNMYLIEQFGEIAGTESIRKETMAQLLNVFGGDHVFLLLMASAAAVISGIQGFSYLYHRNKIDFYQAVPVRQSRRFLTIWLNGILVYLIPSLLGTGLSLLIMAGNHVISGEILRQTWLAYGLILLVYLGCYHMAVLAVMLTGNVFITCLGTGVFFGYEWMIRTIILNYQQMFFSHYSNLNQSDIPYLLPITMYIRYIDKRHNGQGSLCTIVLQLTLFAAAVLALAYWCYRKRLAEAAGKAMAFKVIQPVIKIALAVPAALLAGLLVSNIVGYNPLWGDGSAGFPVFAMVVITIVVCCLMQVVYEFDIRGLLHKKWHILISGVVVALIFLCFSRDLLGYNSYVPRADKVSSAAMIPPYEYSIYGDNYYNEDLKYIDRTGYLEENMYLTDIGTLNKLLQKSIDSLKKCKNLHGLYEDETAEWYTLDVVYRMGSRKTVQRNIYVNLDDPETLELLDRVMGSEEYISAVYGKMIDTLYQIMENEPEGVKLSYAYGNGIYTDKLSKEDMLTLMKCLMEDVRKAKFSETRQEICYGMLEFNVQKESGFYTMSQRKEFKIYSSYENCVAFLKEKGLYEERFIDPDDIEKIQVINYNYDKQNAETMVMDPAMYSDTMTEAVYYSDNEYMDDPYMVSMTYSDRKEIEEICSRLYPMDWSDSGFSSDREYESDYMITVYFKPESDVSLSYGGSAGCYFLKGEVPEYVQEDTACQE